MAQVERIEENGQTLAVLVPEANVIGYTEQVVAASTNSTIEKQIAEVLRRFELPSYDRVACFNVYVARADDASAARKALFAQIPAGERPATTFVVTPLTEPHARVAIDAVLTAQTTEVTQVLKVAGDVDGAPLTAIAPAGRMLYVSGQAESGGDMTEATRATMQSLLTTLEFFGLSASHVVQVKAFLRPMSEHAVARAAMTELFADELSPPFVFVEWTNDAPIEIELVASIPDGKGPAEKDDTVSYHTPPGMTASPVFSRAAIIERGPRIYVSGLYGEPGASGEAQVRSIFDQLQRTLERCGSDLEHLVKATYYVSDDEASTKLNELRPQFYNPERPPAASKAGVHAVGRTGCGITLDMIAAPSK